MARRARGSSHFSIRLSDFRRSRISACCFEDRMVFCGSNPRKVYLVRRRGPSTDSRMKHVSDCSRIDAKTSIGCFLVSNRLYLSLVGLAVSCCPKTIPHGFSPYVFFASCRFYSLRDHFCTLDASLFLTPPASFDRSSEKFVSDSRNLCLNGATNGFNC